MTGQLRTKRKWALLRKAGAVLNDKYSKLVYGEERPAFKYRVAMCQRGVDGPNVSIKRSPNHHNAVFGNLFTCGSAWHCPVCAEKIAAEQVRQINHGIAKWQRGGGGLFLMSFTNQHDRNTAGAGECRARLEALSEALSYLKGLRSYRNLMGAAGSIGVIRGLESTFGERNGWHHHTHEIVFADPAAAPILAGIRKLWARVLIKKNLAGLVDGECGAVRFKKLRALLLYCFDVQDGSKAAAYVAKFEKEMANNTSRWGLASEITRGQLKLGSNAGAVDNEPWRFSHASPWQLLSDALDGDDRSAQLWREFALAFHGRRKLYWSNGLKARFEIADMPDEDIAAGADSLCTEMVASLTKKEWGIVLSRDARFEVLEAAAYHGAAGVVAKLAELAQAPPTHSGYFAEGISWEFRRRAA